MLFEDSVYYLARLLAPASPMLPDYWRYGELSGSSCHHGRQSRFHTSPPMMDYIPLSQETQINPP